MSSSKKMINSTIFPKDMRKISIWTFEAFLTLQTLPWLWKILLISFIYTQKEIFLPAFQETDLTAFAVAGGE